MAGSNTDNNRRRIVRHIAGIEIITDMDGYLQNPFMWSEEVARILAHEAGIEELSKNQWCVLRFIRKYYLEEGKEPMNHKIKSGTGMNLQEIVSLFPGGISRARRLAGLPKSKGCGAG